jgi:hypothetical protein
VQVRAQAQRFGQRLAGLDEPVGEPDAFGLIARHAAAVRIMSIARLWPIRRGRRMVPRSMSGTPKRRQYTPNVASRAATLRSHHSASSSPARDGKAFDRGDHRLAEHEPRRAHRAVAALEAMAAMAGRRLLEVVAGAERATGTGQDRDMLRSIRVEAAEGIGEQGVRSAD